MFVHLHTHSHFSLCRGANSIEELCTAVKKRGMNRLAITDTNGLYGLVWFLQIAREMGIQPIIGAEVVANNLRIILLVKDQIGYRNLCRILSQRHLDRNFSLLKALLRHSAGLFMISDSSPLLNALKNHVPPENLFVELQPNPRRLGLLQYARAAGIPPVATNGVYFINRDDYFVHRLLRAIACNATLSTLDERELASSDAWLKDPRQMAQAFPDCPEALANTERIADQCLHELDFAGPIFPDFKPTTGESPFDYLRRLCYEGARKRYGTITNQVQQRMEYELNIIQHKGFAPYFLVVHDIVQQSRRTCGRGSAAASIVAYCLEITHVDPIAHDLFFERFLNLKRKDPPDIDVDFPWDERDQILDYIFRKYGLERTAMIANQVGFKARAAVREVAKVYGLPAAEINAVTKKLSGYWEVEGINDIIEAHPAYRYQQFQPPWPEILALAEKLQSCPRNLSIHCGGVVITPKDMDHYVPRQRAAKGTTIIQWEKDQAEEAGLVKIDILGNRSLAVIRDALAAIKHNYGVEIQYERWNPSDDPATQELIRNGDTIGVFYVESPAMRLLQKKARTGDFEHLVIHSSIIRPAANDYIREYLKRLHGQPFQPLHPLLGEILKETYGIMCYQEDVSKVAMALADFDAAEADDLRRILSKKRITKRMEDFKLKFYHGAMNKGVAPATIDRIWDMILSFSGYSFCKPHSASFAMVSYQSCYLRAHYPAEFIAAVISNQGGYYSTFAYISEARRMGLTVVLPDINKSEWHYTGKDKTVRVGLMQLQGIQRQSIDQLLAERRQRGPFRSFDDFLTRVPIESSDAKILIKAGLFDEIEPNRTRPQLIWRLLFWHHQKTHHRRPMATLFQETPPPIPPADNYDLKTLLQHEAETLGLLISRHPLTLYKDRLKNLSYILAKDLPLFIGKNVTTIGWLVTHKMTRTRKNELMEFISFEDTTAIYETVFFPNTYRQFCYMLSHSRPYILKGKVEEEFGAVTLNVAEIKFL